MKAQRHHPVEVECSSAEVPEGATLAGEEAMGQVSSISGLSKLGPSPDPVGSPFSLLCQDLRQHGALLRNRSDVAA